MSNRVLGILVLLGFILVGIGLYLYAFVYYNGSLRIESNIGEYSVTLEPKQITKTITKECLEEFCLFGELSPFEYEMIVSKLGYRTIRENISIRRNQSMIISIDMQKEVLLEKVLITGKEKHIGDGDTREVDQIEEGNNGSNGNSSINKGDKNIEGQGNNTEKTEKELAKQRKVKLKYLRNSMKNHAYFEFLNVGEVFFKQKDNKVIASLVDEFGDSYSIHTFSEKISKKHINVIPIDGDDNGLIIEYGDRKYMFHKSYGTFDELDMKISINYVKTLEDGLYGFVTEKGLFHYSIGGDKKFQYFNMFSDYIIDGERYIGLILGSDDRRKRNMNLDNERGDLIVLHNLETKENRVLKKLNFTVKKILKNSTEIELIDNKGEMFILRNLD